MALVTIEALCGHTYREQMYGPHRGRESRQAWLENRDCPDCWKEQRAKERAGIAILAAEQNQVDGLPALIGSPKQIAWAETIRVQKIPALREMESKLIDNGSNSARVEEAKKILQSRVMNPQARFWIDNRETDFSPQWLVGLVDKALRPLAA